MNSTPITAFATLGLAIIFAPKIHADVDACGNVLHYSMDSAYSSDNLDYRNVAQNRICHDVGSRSFETLNTSRRAEIQATVSIFSGNGAYSSDKSSKEWEADWHKFCQDSAVSQTLTKSQEMAVHRVANAALEAWVRCIELREEGVKVAQSSTRFVVDLNLTATGVQTLQGVFIEPPGGFTCHANTEKGVEELGRGSRLEFGPAHGLAVHCARNGEERDGVRFYPEARITLGLKKHFSVDVASFSDPPLSEQHQAKVDLLQENITLLQQNQASLQLALSNSANHIQAIETRIMSLEAQNPKFFLPSSMVVGCSNPKTGTTDSCECPQGTILVGLHHTDIKDDGVDAEKVTALLCATVAISR